MIYNRTVWKFSPSLMCMGYLSIEKKIAILDRSFNSLHIDIMDGHFCKSIHLSPDYVKDISRITKLPIAVHLMVENPLDYICQLIENGASMIIIHIEVSQTNIFRIIDTIHKANKKIGIALCPSTPIESISYLLDYIDMVTVLNVDPGFSGQLLIPESLKKISKIKELKQENNYSFVIQADGGVRDTTFSALVSAGTEDFVIGNAALFSKSSDLQEAIRIMYKDFNKAIGI